MQKVVGSNPISRSHERPRQVMSGTLFSWMLDSPRSDAYFTCQLDEEPELLTPRELPFIESGRVKV